MTSELAGRLRERVRVMRWAGTPDGAGGAVAAFGEAGDIWAAVELLRPGPEVSADQRGGRARYRVTLRDRDGVDLATRLDWRGLELSVRGIARDPATPGLVELVTEAQL